MRPGAIEIVLATCVGFAAASLAPALDAQVPAGFQKPLEGLALELARGCAKSEALEVVAALAGLGLEPEPLARLRLAALDAPEPKKGQRPDPARLAQAVRKAARALGPALAGLEPPIAREAARTLLDLDDGVAEAHRVLGHVPAGKGFVDEAAAAGAARRALMQDAVARARKLEIPVEVGVSSHPLLVKITGRRGTQVRWQGLTLHTAWPEEKAARVVRDIARAEALSGWLLTGELAPGQVREVIVHFDARAAYERAIAELQSHDAIIARDAPAALQMAGVHCKNDDYIAQELVESRLIATLFARKWMHTLPPILGSGHVQWISLALLGTAIPQFTTVERTTHEGAADGRTRASDPEAAVRDELRLLAQGGLVGCRSWLAYLARRREDPAWTRPPKEQFAQVVGDDLMKCTLVAEHLHERNRFAALAQAIGEAQPGTEAFAAVVERTLGAPLSEFEAGWRRWLLAGEGDLARRLETRDAQALTADERAVLAYLNKLRAAALTIPEKADERVAAGIERSRSAACAAHATYLLGNQAQLTAWPDAHEEYPDRAGFSADGAWAGLHSVIAPGVGSMNQAIDAWMGTFYHRLPLLEPGLLRIGYALRGDVAVLDAGSLCIPLARCLGHAVWPPPNAKGVPTRFVPELPNPVPGADQSKFGFPVTLQLGMRATGRTDAVVMTLHEGGERGPVVDCHYSTPLQPTNKECVPHHCFGLIPKAALKANTTYTVIADVPGELGRLVWSFKT